MRNIALLLATLVIIASQESRASVILSNLDGNDGTSTSFSDGNRSKAMGFAIGAGAVTLDSVILRLQIGDFSTVSMDVALFSDSGSSTPSSRLLTFDNPSFSANETANFTFDAPSPYVLEASTTYWIVVRDFANQGAITGTRWTANSPGISPVDPDSSTIDATHVGTKFSTATYPPVGISSTLNSYALVAVPEPIHLAGIVGLGLGGFLIARHARRSAH